MKHTLRRFVVFILVLAIVVSMLPAVFAATGTLSANSGVRDAVCTELSSKAKSYYTGSYTYEKLSALKGASDTSTSYNAIQGNALYSTLYTLMSSTHTNNKVVYGGYSSNALATYWEKTDAENKSSTYLYFYTDILANDASVSSMQMNREHVWPKSRASFYQTNGGADLHHLRPSIQGVNSAKSNNAFADLVGTGASYKAYKVNGQDVIWTGSKSNVGSVLEVRDNVKGDVARILLYVYVRWQQPNLYTSLAASQLPALDDDDVNNGGNNGQQVIESLDTLLEWMEKDPVDAWEMSRNDQIENVQGNRNVFIDYPELAYLMFSQPIPKMQTPSGIANSIKPTEESTEPTEPTEKPTEPTEKPTEPTEKPTEPTNPTVQPGGDYVAIYSVSGSKVMTTESYTYNGKITKLELCSADAALSGGKLTTSAANVALFKIVNNSDGTISFKTKDGKYLEADGTNVQLVSAESANTKFVLEAAGSDYYIKCANASYEGKAQYIEFYSNYFTVYGMGTDPSIYTFNFYPVNSGSDPTEPTEKPTEPTEKPTEPTEKPTEPTEKPTQPTEKPTQPTEKPTEPTEKPTEPTVKPTEKPTVLPSQYYTITWCVNSKVYREICAKGEIPVFSGSTDRPADDKYTYTFAGWSPRPVPAYADATYTATYTATPIRPEGVYTITWDVNGKKTEEEYEAGTIPVFTGSTDKPDSNGYVYCFAGWSPAVEEVTENTTYTALYNKLPLVDCKGFIDVTEDQWFYEEVNRAAQLGLFNGISYRRFDPAGAVSRAMIVTVLYRMEGEPEVNMKRCFADVPTDRWYSSAILWAYNEGIAKGTSATTFDPDLSVTREQMAAFLYRYAEWKDYDMTAAEDLSDFEDGADASAYAEAPLTWAVSHELLTGSKQDGSLYLEPQGTATRAQAAAIMVRFFNSFIK